MNFVDVILPVPIEGFFAGALPEGRWQGMRVGIRVLVPLGKKSYFGVVVRMHQQEPTEYQVKPVVEVMDEKPSILESQYRLWQWISDY